MEKKISIGGKAEKNLSTPFLKIEGKIPAYIDFVVFMGNQKKNFFTIVLLVIPAAVEIIHIRFILSSF